MDRTWFKSPYECKSYIYYYNLWFLYCGTGVFICHWGSYPRRDGIDHGGLYWLLLHHKTRDPWHAQYWNTQSSPWMLSLALGECSIWIKGFNLPCQHLMIHYVQLIHAPGAPNRLCSSITESKHIEAMKEPWRWSNCWNALGQMLITNLQLDKLAATCADITSCGMLEGTCLSWILGTNVSIITIFLFE